MYIKELTNEQFMNFTNLFPIKSLYQTPEYAFVMNKQGYDTVFLGLIDNNNIVAATLVLIEKKFGFKYAYAPRGFLIDYNNYHLLETFTTEIKKYLGKCDVMAIKINPLIIKNRFDIKYKVVESNNYYDNIYNSLIKLGYYHLGYNNNFEAFKPRFEAVINISDHPYNLFNNIKKEFRTKIRGASKNGVKVYRGDDSNLEYLYRHTKKNYPRDIKYFKDVYNFYSKRNMVEFYYAKLDTKDYLKQTQIDYSRQDEINNSLNQEVIINAKANNQKLLNRKLESDKLKAKYESQIVKATNYLRNYPDGLVLATALVIKHDKEVYLLMDGYDKNYKSFNAKHLLIWKLIEKFSKLGYTTFNLGGVSNINNPNNAYHNLNMFKTNFNAKVIEYIGDLELITNNTLYFMYRQAAPIRNILKK